MEIILASTSPRRRELVKQLDYDFIFMEPNFDESKIKKALFPSQYVRDAAMGKARSIKIKDKIIITCDTIVVDKQIIGKPIDKDDAFKTLKSLMGHPHGVYSCVCLKYNNSYATFIEHNTVELVDLSDEEIVAYINTYNVLDKAGSYSIQDGIVKSFDGDETNIIGLPMKTLKRALELFIKDQELRD